MTEFFLGFPDVPFDAVSITSSETAETGFEAENTILGSRADYFRLADSTTNTLSLTYSLTSNAQAEFLWLGRASMLQGAKVDSITLNAGSTIYQNTAFLSETLTGRKTDDFLATFARCAPAKPFVLSLSATSASYYPFSKAYFGLWFDMGRDPRRGYSVSASTDSEVARSDAMTFSLSWEGVTEAKVTELTDSILENADVSPLVLYDSSGKVLPGCTTMHATLEDHSITPDSVPGQYTVSLTFKELV